MRQCGIPLAGLDEAIRHHQAVGVAVSPVQEPGQQENRHESRSGDSPQAAPGDDGIEAGHTAGQAGGQQGGGGIQEVESNQFDREFPQGIIQGYPAQAQRGEGRFIAEPADHGRRQAGNDQQGQAGPEPFLEQDRMQDHPQGHQCCRSACQVAQGKIQTGEPANLHQRMTVAEHQAGKGSRQGQDDGHDRHQRGVMAPGEQQQQRHKQGGWAGPAGVEKVQEPGEQQGVKPHDTKDHQGRSSGIPVELNHE